MSMSSLSSSPSESSSLRFSSWVLTVSSVWALFLSDITSSRFPKAKDSNDFEMLLFLFGACSLTWASPLAQLFGTRVKPGFRLLLIFQGGTSTILLQAFAWSCYAVAVFGCVILLVNPEINLLGMKAGISLLGLVSQVLIEMSISTFQYMEEDTSSASPLKSFSFFHVTIFIGSLLASLAAFLCTLVVEVVVDSPLEKKRQVWNFALLLFVVSFVIPQAAVTPPTVTVMDDEVKTMSRTFAWVMLLCTVWIYGQLHWTESASRLRGSTFGLGLVGFLSCMLSLYAQWMHAKRPSSPSSKSHSSSSSSPRSRRQLRKELEPTSYPSFFFYALSVLVASLTVLAGYFLPYYGTWLCLVNSVLAHYGIYCIYSPAMQLARPLQGGMKFAFFQGVGWMGFGMVLCMIMVFYLSQQQQDQWSADSVFQRFFFPMSFLSQMCLLGSKFLFQPEPGGQSFVEPLSKRVDVPLLLLLGGSIGLQQVFVLPSLLLALVAFGLRGNRSNQSTSSSQWGWTLVLGCSVLSMLLQDIVWGGVLGGMLGIVRAVAIYVMATTSTVSNSSPVRSDHEEELDRQEVDRLLSLCTRTRVVEQVKKELSLYHDEEEKEQTYFFHLLLIHLVLFASLATNLTSFRVLVAPAYGLGMEFTWLRALHHRSSLNYQHVLGWICLALSIPMHLMLTNHALLPGCCGFSYCGLMLLVSINVKTLSPTPNSSSSNTRESVGWILNLMGLLLFLGIDFWLLQEDSASNQSQVGLFPVIFCAWLAIAASVPLAYFTQGKHQSSSRDDAFQVLGVALWTFSLFLILWLLGRRSTDAMWAYSKTGMASLLGQSLMSKNSSLLATQCVGLGFTLFFLHLFLPTLRFFLDYPMWYYAYYFKSWRHSLSPDGVHPYQDVVVKRNIAFPGNGLMDGIVPCEDPNEGFPPIVFMHGGAHLFCTREIFIHSMTPFARAQLSLYAVEYPLSPESKFPRPLVTVLYALHFLMENHCQSGCCLRGESPKRCKTCQKRRPNEEEDHVSLCGCCKHYRGTQEVQLLGDSAGGNLAAMVCLVLTNRAIFDEVFSSCADYNVLVKMKFPTVIRVGLIYALLGREVGGMHDQEDKQSLVERWKNKFTVWGLDFILDLYSGKSTQGDDSLPPQVLLNDFLLHPNGIKSFAKETLMIVGTRDPLLYPNRLAYEAIQTQVKKCKVDLIEMEGSFHGYHGVPPQWTLGRWKSDALPTTLALIRLFTGSATGIAKTNSGIDLDTLPRDFSPLVVFPVLGGGIFLLTRVVLTLVGEMVTV